METSVSFYVSICIFFNKMSNTSNSSGISKDWGLSDTSSEFLSMWDVEDPNAERG